jgi:uncharacterized hydrophobic protein (TIGR00271 family)
MTDSNQNMKPDGESSNESMHQSSDSQQPVFSQSNDDTSTPIPTTEADEKLTPQQDITKPSMSVATESQDGVQGTQPHLSKNVLLRAFVNIRTVFRSILNLEDGVDRQGTVEGISKEIDFLGHKAWILAFAILLASIGLNVNSTAVIIGAMLVSPLMGPILGIGLSVGLNDFSKLKRSLKSLGIAVLISIVVSTIYYSISPLADAQSELLARTRPTIYDVLVALFGGFAGIVAISRREKTNVIPGVAIATALMPPLCTVGYGLATTQWIFALGAFYLFFINSVFISIATLIGVRLMGFEPVTFLDKEREKKAKLYITAFAFMTILPSVYVAYEVIQESIFTNHVNSFVHENFVFDNSKVISTKMFYDPDSSRIEVTLIGDVIEENVLKNIRRRLPQYSIDHANLIIYQSKDASRELEGLDQKIRTGIIEDLYRKNEEVLQDRDNKIALLEEELLKYKAREIPTVNIAKELAINYPEIRSFAYSDVVKTQLGTLQADTIPTMYIEWEPMFRPSKKEVAERKERIEQLQQWLAVRLENDSLDVVEIRSEDFPRAGDGLPPM